MAIQAIQEFRIGEGGLLRRFERAARLTRLSQQIAIALATTWLPVMLLAILNRRLTGRWEPFVYRPAMHVRLLVAMPVLLALDHVFPRVCRTVLGQLVTQSFVPTTAQARFDRLLRVSTRMADSAFPELLMIGLALAIGFGQLLGLVPMSGVARGTPLSPILFWYALVDVPFLQFLLWRALWRWAVWVRVLVGLSRIDLDLVAGHPDRRGGISFLRWPSIGYCSMLLFAISSVLCAEQGSRLAFGASLASFTPLLLVFGTAGTLIAFGPLLLFTPQLMRARRDGLVEYARLGSEYGRGFQRRWIRGRPSAERIGPRSTQPLSDLGAIYRDTVERLRPLIFEKRDLVALLLAILLPLVPVILLRVPAEDWKRLLALLTGGVVP